MGCRADNLWRRRRSATLILLLVFAWLTGVAAARGDTLLRTDSRAPYAHRLTLYDEEGKAISPKDEPAQPYSPATTCGKCHPSATIGSGWHFSATDPKFPAGRPGEPWILVDPRTATQLPLSYRNWPGTYRPQEVGISQWQFVQLFGRHMCGGGVGDLSQAEQATTAEKARWAISGALRNDCMSCHAADGSYDFNQRATQIQNQNLRWAPTTALGLGVVTGTAKSVPDDFDPDLPPDPDHPERATPQVNYDKTRFDADDRVLFRITRRPSAEQCYACHTTRHRGSQIWETDQDVHLKAGLTCADCHRHGLDHAMARGDEQASTTLSCKGCHLGEADAPGGRMGAPVPQHAGLPPLHLEKLTCTACHSGPMLGNRAARVQTAMAHQLGLATRDRDEAMLPAVLEPVFMRQPDGKIGPQRVLWPAFWGYLEDGVVTPLNPEEVSKTAGAILPAPSPATGASLSDKQIGQVLHKLLPPSDDPRQPVYVAGGRAFQLVSRGSLVPMEHKAAEPYAWPIAHDVRPKSQSLGAGGCVDCHSVRAPMLFAAAPAESPAQLDVTLVPDMCSLQGLDRSYQRLLAASFTLRPWFKGVCFGASGILAAVLLLGGLRGLEGLLRWSGGQPPMQRITSPAGPQMAGMRLSRWERLVHWLLLASVLVLAVGGIWPAMRAGMFGALSGWPLLVHVAAGGVFAAAVVAMVLAWTDSHRLTTADRRFGLSQKALFWITGIAVLATILSVALSMMPLFGTEGMLVLAQAHRYAGLLLLLVVLVHAGWTTMSRSAGWSVLWTGRAASAGTSREAVAGVRQEVDAGAGGAGRHDQFSRPE